MFGSLFAALAQSQLTECRRYKSSFLAWLTAVFSEYFKGFAALVCITMPNVKCKLWGRMVAKLYHFVFGTRMNVLKQIAASTSNWAWREKLKNIQIDVSKTCRTVLEMLKGRIVNSLITPSN